jgi:hypothetical protein
MLHITLRVCACVLGCACTGAGVCLCVCSLTNPGCNAPPYCHLRPLWHDHIFQHNLINVTIFREKLLDIKCIFQLSLQLLFETFLILKRIRWDIVINVKTFPCKVPVILVGFYLKLNFFDRFSKSFQISSFIKIQSVGAKLFHADRRIDKHGDANSRFSQVYESAYKSVLILSFLPFKVLCRDTV